MKLLPNVFAKLLSKAKPLYAKLHYQAFAQLHLRSNISKSVPEPFSECSILLEWFGEFSLRFIRLSRFKIQFVQQFPLTLPSTCCGPFK